MRSPALKCNFSREEGWLFLKVFEPKENERMVLHSVIRLERRLSRAYVVFLER